MTSDSAVPDYISIILRAIEKAQNDPAQLRQLIYDIARISLGKQVLLSYTEIGSEKLRQQISNLETAIEEVEVLKSLEPKLLAREPFVPMVEGPISAGDHTTVIIDDPVNNLNGSHFWDGDTTLVARRPSARLYQKNDLTSEFLPSAQVSTSSPGTAAKHPKTARFFKFELAIAVLIGLAIYAVTLVRSDYFGGFIFPAGQVTRGAAVPAPMLASVDDSNDALSTSAGIQKRDFPLPSIYGVYAVNQKTLYALDRLAMKVPDPRVTISAMITSPSRVAVPNGKLEFVVYRRDLATSAPDSVPVRIVARVMRELKFSTAGPPKTVTVEGEWAIRNKSFDLGAAPLKNSREMIILRPMTPDFSFSPGRYVLVLKGQGFDFSVAGPMTDPAHCLERTDAMGGMVYSECPSVH